jgi:hypothetical protein
MDLKRTLGGGVGHWSWKICAACLVSLHSDKPESWLGAWTAGFSIFFACSVDSFSFKAFQHLDMTKLPVGVLQVSILYFYPPLVASCRRCFLQYGIGHEFQVVITQIYKPTTHPIYIYRFCIDQNCMMPFYYWQIAGYC